MQTSQRDDVTPLKNVLTAVSWIAAIHLVFKVADMERTPFGDLGDWGMALFIGYAFVQAELISVASIATPVSTAQRVWGFLTYIGMMVLNGVIQAGYYYGSDNEWLAGAMGGVIVAVGVGIAFQYMSMLGGMSAQQRAKVAAQAQQAATDRAQQQQREQREWELAVQQREQAMALQRIEAETRLAEQQRLLVTVSTPVTPDSDTTTRTRNDGASAVTRPVVTEGNVKEKMFALFSEGLTASQAGQQLGYPAGHSTPRGYYREWQQTQQMEATA